MSFQTVCKMAKTQVGVTDFLVRDPLLCSQDMSGLVSCVQDEPEITNESDDESGSNEEMPNLEAMDLEVQFIAN